MQKYYDTSHSTYVLKVHWVEITEFSKPVLFKDVAVRLRNLIHEVCKSMDIKMVKGYVSKDHAHFCVPVLPYWSVSKVMCRINGKTVRRLLAENRQLSREF